MWILNFWREDEASPRQMELFDHRVTRSLFFHLDHSSMDQHRLASGLMRSSSQWAWPNVCGFGICDQQGNLTFRCIYLEACLLSTSLNDVWFTLSFPGVAVLLQHWNDMGEQVKSYPQDSQDSGVVNSCRYSDDQWTELGSHVLGHEFWRVSGSTGLLVAGIWW